MIPASISVQI